MNPKSKLLAVLKTALGLGELSPDSMGSPSLKIIRHMPRATNLERMAICHRDFSGLACGQHLHHVTNFHCHG